MLTRQEAKLEEMFGSIAPYPSTYSIDHINSSARSNSNESPFSYNALYLADNHPLDHWAQDFRETSVNSVTQHSYQDTEEDETWHFLVMDDSPSPHGPPSVLYRDHPDLSCLQSTQFMNLDQAFRFLHAACVMCKLKPQDLPSGAQTVISRFKSEFASRHGAGYYSFYDSRRDVGGGVSQPKMAYHLWHVWCLTRYCGHKIQLLDNNKVVRLDTLDEDPFSLGVTIYYHYYVGEEAESLQSLRKGFRYIGHIISQDQEYGLHCDIDTCNCSTCL